MGTSFNSLRAPINDALEDTSGLASRTMQNWMLSVTKAVQQNTVLPLTLFGAAGQGADDTAVFQAAINQALALGGAVVFIPAGNYSINTVTVPVGTSAVTFQGVGDSTVINRRGVLAPGTGLFDIYGSNVTFDSLVIDGNVFTPTGLLYNLDFQTIDSPNDPMAPSLTVNTSIWIHGPSSNFTFQNIRISHTGGYAVLVDGRTSGEVDDVSFLNCRFENNRPNLFGITLGAAIFGSWTGGILVAGDGRTGHPGRIVKHVVVSECRFQRNDGNCFWSHLLGLQELHQDFRVVGCAFTDCGLDGVEIGGVVGGAVVGNMFRRIGYTTMTDTDRPIPRWLLNVNATAIDSSGLVKSVVYSNNVIISANGGALDLDGHGLSAFTGNVIRVPFSDEPEYDEDSIAISGPNNNGSDSYGFNCSNTQGNPYGASDLSITGNTLINLRAGAVRLYATRRCLLSGNVIIAPPDSVVAPVSMGPIGPAAGQRCYNNKITLNDFDYNPVAAAPCVIEDDTYSTFLGSESNTVCNNVPITPSGTLAIEFTKSPASGSTVYSMQVWFP